MDFPDHWYLAKDLDRYRRRVSREIATNALSRASTCVSIAESRQLMARIDAQLKGVSDGALLLPPLR
jgi:hypothetical protein